jgi:hypothetical protein
MTRLGVACSVVAIVQDGADGARDDAAMKTFTSLSPIAIGVASRQPLRRVTDALISVARAVRLRWQRAQWDETTRFLSEAVDHADLERRQRALEYKPGRRLC